MNYASFIVKIVKTPTKIFINKVDFITKVMVQIPHLALTSNIIIMNLLICGKLGKDLFKYYKIDDYIIVEGYIRFSSESEKNFKEIELTVCKIYPFILDIEFQNINS